MHAILWLIYFDKYGRVCGMQPHPGTATGLVYKILRSCFIGYSAHSKLYVYATDLYAALISL
jgi:hypothetical protein